MSSVNPKEVSALVIGIFICIATPITLLPQAYKLIKNRSSEGVSFLTIGFASLNAFLSFLNVTILNWTFIERCQQNGYILCFDKIVVCTQMLLLFYFYTLNLSLCIIFYWFPKKTEKNQYYEELDKEDPVSIKEKVIFGITNTGFVILFILLLALATTGIILMFVFGKNSHEAKVYGEVMGYGATVLVFVQWTPQIIRTILEKSSGSFSVLMISIMTPASFCTCAYLWLLSDQHFSTYLSYLCSGIQQLILLILCLFYDIRNKCYPTTKSIQEDDFMQE